MDYRPFDPSRPPLAQNDLYDVSERVIPYPKGNNKKIRFAIGREKALSEIWTLSSRKNDIYLSCESTRGRIKLSVHGSGVCQLAFDSLYVEEALKTPRFPLKDRTIRRWTRLPTPDAGPVHVTTIYFSAFETWGNSQELECTKPTELIPPPPSGFALSVPIFLSKDNPTEKCAPFEPEEIILGYFRIETGEYVTMLTAPVRLPDDYFHFRELSWFMSVGAEAESDWDDARGISSVSFEGREDGGVDFHSMHNMRITTLPIETDLNALNQDIFRSKP